MKQSFVRTTLFSSPATYQPFGWATFLGERTASKYAILALLGSFALALSAQVMIPFYPVPITGQTLAVMLLGFLFGSKLASATVLLYLAEGALGLPVFAGMTPGAVAFFSPSVGYLIGFVFGAYACGYLAEHGFDRSYSGISVTLVIANAIIFAFGLLGLGFYFGFDQPLLQMGLWPFVPGAVIKSALLFGVLPKLWSYQFKS